VIFRQTHYCKSTAVDFVCGADYFSRMFALVFAFLFVQGPLPEDQMVSLATSLFRSGQVERAVAMLEPFVNSNPKAFKAADLLATGYVGEGKYNKARVLASKVVAAFPKDYNAEHTLALSLMGLNRVDEAEVHFKRALELKADFAEASFQLGLLYGAKGAIESARSAFKRTIELGYRPAESRTQLASLDIKQGQYAQAIDELKAAIKISPDYSEAYFVLSDALRKSGAAQEAAEATKRFQSLSESAQDKRRRLAKGQSLYEEGMRLLFGPKREFIEANFNEAYGAFKSATEVFPELDAAHYRMAQIAFLRNDYQTALNNIRRALELNPNEPEYYFVLSSVLKDRDPRTALDAATHAISLNPNVADFHNLQGMLFSKLGEYAKAAESYKRATELNPEEEAYRLNLSSALERIPKNKPE